MVALRVGFLPGSASNFGIIEEFYLIELFCGVAFTEPTTHTVLLFRICKEDFMVFSSNWVIKKKRKQTFLFILIVITFPAS